MQLLRYNTTEVIIYNKSIRIKPVANCNGFTVVNVGDDIVTVNGRVLYPGTPGSLNGDSFTIGGNLGEIFTGDINISFGGVGANPSVSVEQKFYIL